MTEVRTIKKYPNRRLYDTTISKYITLSDVKDLVMNREMFRILDAKTKEDLTRSVLLQIILEQEEDGEPIMSSQMLEQLIRFYGDPVQSALAKYLEKSVALLTEQRLRVRNNIEQVADPMGFMTDLTNRNLKVWQDMQANIIKASGMPFDTSRSKK